MKLADRTIAPAPHGTGPYIIAEIGVNHDGSPERALKLVDAAAAAGADAVKLQLFRADTLLSRAAVLADYQAKNGAADPFSMLHGLELEPDAMRAVYDRARACGLHAIITVFSRELITMAEALGVDAYKTASPDVINRPLLQDLVRTGRPLLVSTGTATLAEVARAAEWLETHPHLFLHCVSAYPTPDEEASLAARQAMFKVTSRALGYSDHTTSLDTGALAVASGACLLEKHLTYDRNASGPDHAASFDPDQFAEYVRLARRAWRMLGAPVKEVRDVEREVHRISRQSIVVRRDLPAGHVLTVEDLTVKRPGTGLPPEQFEAVLGRPLVREVSGDTPLVEDDLA
ncbi:MAG: N-acetylneuraminate synthase [Phycisphaerales bacterium]|nr:MAG: N-acetylneuraminate synthase [Phycisphaerales bacterium]